MTEVPKMMKTPSPHAIHLNKQAFLLLSPNRYNSTGQLEIKPSQTQAFLLHSSPLHNAGFFAFGVIPFANPLRTVLPQASWNKPILEVPILWET